jgi:hypothetical protein
MTRRALCSGSARLVRALAASALALVAGCTSAPVAPAAATAGDAPLAPWRTVIGGFLAPATAPFGMPARPGTGAFVKLIAPTAIALRGNDLLIVDSGAGRVWRADLSLNTLSPVVGAPATPMTAVTLGADQSAWVLDGVARQVLRFARDGRLMQTYRTSSVAAPGAFTLADGGATLLVADEAQRQWVEYRAVGAFPVSVRPGGSDDTSVLGVDGLASNGDLVYVLDRKAGAVHVARRDGTLRARLGDGVLKQPVAIAVDRFGRVVAHDAQDRTLKLLSPDGTLQVLVASQLRVQEIGGLALDEGRLAVADRLTGAVVIHLLPNPERP